MPKVPMSKKPMNKTICGVDCSGLNPRQRLFVERWVLCRNYTQAAKEAGYSNPNKQGYNLSHNPSVKRVLDAIERSIGKKLEVSLEMAREKLVQSLNRNYHDLADLLPIMGKIPPQCFAYIDSVKRKPIYDLVGNKEEGYTKVLIDEEIEIRMMPNATAIDLAMKHLGGYAPTQEEKTIVIKWDQFTAPPEDADSVEKEIANIEYSVEKVEPSSNDLEDETFG